MFIRWSVLLACLIAPAGRVTADDQVDRMKAYEWVMAGNGLTATEATTLENALKKKPENLEYRAKLAAYYETARFGSSNAGPPFREHALWILRHHPASSVAGLPHVHLDPSIDAMAYREAVRIWDEHIQKNPAHIEILSNAASFFRFFEKDRAEKYLTKLRQIDPNNPEWCQRLGHLYALGSYTSTGPDVAQAKKSLASYEEAMRKGKGDRRLSLWLEQAALAAVWAGEYEKAEKYAADVLSTAVEARPSWNFGNALHHGNLVLGHVALRRGDVEAAGRFLIRAGKTPGSPQLNSFGPNMALALELAKKGQLEVVIEYMKQCKSFWNGPELGNWLKEVEQGLVPDFGEHLNY